MESEQVIQLYPLPSNQCRLEGLYLSHDLRKLRKSAEPFVFSNYVVSLDGRIAVPVFDRPDLVVVPKEIANDRDWRLFQELATQADLIFTSGRYLRDYAAGRAQEILRVHEDERFVDLLAWRKEQGLSPQPDMAVISASLRFPVPEALTTNGRRVLIITTASAGPERIKALSVHAEVVIAGNEAVDAGIMIEKLYQLGYEMIYNATGPKVLHLLLSAGKLDRLYLTHVPRILGGMPFSTIVEGGLVTPPADFKLSSLYLDQVGQEGLGQLFACYEQTGA